MLETVKTLCALSGVSGWEDEVRDYILERAIPYADKIETDPMGNLFVFKRGRISPAQPLLVCAHMDEVGLIITGYLEDGSLRFDFVGGVDRRVVLGKRVAVGPAAIPGVIGLKAYHLVDDDEEKTVPRLDSLYVDIGCESEEEARALVQLGWRGTFDNRVELFGDGFIKAKALDDRVGCAAMLKMLECELPADTWFGFHVQEEVGCRGAITAANRIRPSAALILEGTTAADLAGVEEGKQVCRLGQGIVIPFMDRGTIYPRSMLDIAHTAADRLGIVWQTKELVAGGTDASAVQRSCGGVRVLTMSAPLRSIHSPASVGKISDFIRMPELCLAILEELSHDEG